MPSRKDLVYLTQVYAPYFSWISSSCNGIPTAYNRKEPLEQDDHKWAIIEIDTSFLDANNFFPEEDFLEQADRHYTQYTQSDTELNLELTLDNNQEITKEKHAQLKRIFKSNFNYPNIWECGIARSINIKDVKEIKNKLHEVHQSFIQCTTMEERTLWIRDNLELFQHKWKRSLDWIGGISFKGCIPAHAISKISLFEPKSNKMILMDCVDTSISCQNFRFCKNKYKNSTAWLMGESFTIKEWSLDDTHQSEQHKKELKKYLNKTDGLVIINNNNNYQPYTPALGMGKSLNLQRANRFAALGIGFDTHNQTNHLVENINFAIKKNRLK